MIFEKEVTQKKNILIIIGKNNNDNIQKNTCISASKILEFSHPRLHNYWGVCQCVLPKKSHNRGTRKVEILKPTAFGFFVANGFDSSKMEKPGSKM